jgi:hypothetical protein
MFSPETVSIQNAPIVTRFLSQATRFVDGARRSKGLNMRDAGAPECSQGIFQPFIIFPHKAPVRFRTVSSLSCIFNNLAALVLGSF